MKHLAIALSIFLCYNVFSQKKAEVDIVSVIDDLTVRWDETAIKMKNYQGIQEFCLTEEYRKATINLLDNIHHWDTSLYFIVKEKFDINKDKEAEATLRDIEKLETEYSTANFKKFITDECDMLKVIHESFDQETVKQYEKDIRKFEKELVKYLNSITYRIDIIDEHIHHLNFE